MKRIDATGSIINGLNGNRSSSLRKRLQVRRCANYARYAGNDRPTEKSFSKNRLASTDASLWRFRGNSMTQFCSAEKNPGASLSLSLFVARLDLEYRVAERGLPHESRMWNLLLRSTYTHTPRNVKKILDFCARNPMPRPMSNRRLLCIARRVCTRCRWLIIFTLNA